MTLQITSSLPRVLSSHPISGNLDFCRPLKPVTHFQPSDILETTVSTSWRPASPILVPTSLSWIKSDALTSKRPVTCAPSFPPQIQPPSWCSNITAPEKNFHPKKVAQLLRKPKKPVPEDQKTEKYFEYRRRNNALAKKSRDKKNESQLNRQKRILELEQTVNRLERDLAEAHAHIAQIQKKTISTISAPLMSFTSAPESTDFSNVTGINNFSSLISPSAPSSYFDGGEPQQLESDYADHNSEPPMMRGNSLDSVPGTAEHHPSTIVPYHYDQSVSVPRFRGSFQGE